MYSERRSGCQGDLIGSVFPLSDPMIEMEGVATAAPHYGAAKERATDVDTSHLNNV